MYVQDVTTEWVFVVFFCFFRVIVYSNENINRMTSTSYETPFNNKSSVKNQILQTDPSRTSPEIPSTQFQKNNHCFDFPLDNIWNDGFLTLSTEFLNYTQNMHGYESTTNNNIGGSRVNNHVNGKNTKNDNPGANVVDEKKLLATNNNDHNGNIHADNNKNVKSDQMDPVKTVVSSVVDNNNNNININLNNDKKKQQK